jgi:hypothetical protein
MLCDACRHLRDDVATAIAQAVAQERAEAQKMIDRKNAALARPCISCGYQPKILAPTGGRDE